ncbi:MAG: phage tail tape measure protein, partial [Bacteroidaceae bacterium]|nr:phage tail tape measure protein [Bacteroidaceae bacterium]
MSNKIALATIQFKADATGANAALESMRESAKKAEEKVEELQRAFDNGIKTMKDANGVEFDVAKRLKEANAEARSFRDGISQLIKGATALEAVVKNIRLGEIEKNTRGELIGARNALNLRRRNLKEEMPDYAERKADFDSAENEINKQLNRIDHDTDRLLQTLRDGGSVAKEVIEKEIKGLDDMLRLIPETTEEWKKYAAQLKEIQGYVGNMRKEELKQATSILGEKDLGQYNETQIRKAIDAGKELIKTYETASPEAKKLAAEIVRAEEHVEQYGVNAERSARKEAKAVEEAARKRKESDDMMQQQLQKGASLTESALKQQEAYWRKLIDDPKTAASSLQQYQANLAQVKTLQEQMASGSIATKGQEALAFFRGDTSNASTTQIQEQAKALKLYRDSLPRKTEATVINEINGYLEKAGAISEKAAAKTMSFKQAMQIGISAGSGNFKGTTEQLNLAKKTLEEMSQGAVKGGLAWRRMQEQLSNVNLELARTGHISGEVKGILDKPKGHSFNELKQAVEQGRIALNNMRRDTAEQRKEYDKLAASIKSADKEMKNLGESSRGTATSFEKAWSRLKTYIGLYVSAAVAMQKVIGTMGDLLTLSDKMGEVRKTTGFTADEVGRLSDSLAKMDTRTSLNSLLELSVTAGQLGLKTEQDVRGFTEAANMLMVALPEMGKEGATAMLKVALATGEINKIKEQMQQGLIEGTDAVSVAMTKIGSTIDALRANSAAAAPAITDFVKRVGAVGAQSGITIDQVAALGSTVDALGLRVEMSATAISRMIPAIKNNAFAVGEAIGLTAEQIEEMYEREGGAMEVFLMVLEKMRGKDADSIEQMLGKGGMANMMKELNQQGARAGIVFAGLSQNIDELRRQLVIAEDAYEENVAIMDEYNKMNETAAAKWARLKNEIEEMFVSSKGQSILGGIIDKLRAVVNWIAEDGILVKALKGIMVYWAFIKLDLANGFLVIARGFKNMGVALLGGLNQIGVALFGMTKMSKGLTKAWKEMDATMKANIFIALGAAIYYAINAWKDFTQRVDNVTEALQDAEASFSATERSVGNLFFRLHETTIKQQDAADSATKLKKEEEKLASEVEYLNQHLDEGANVSEKLKKKQEELETAHKKVATAEGEAAHQTERRMGIIAEINSKYSEYLGYMLSEASTAETVATSHDLIVASLKEEMYWREQNNAFETVRKQHGDALKSAQGKALAEINGLSTYDQQSFM